MKYVADSYANYKDAFGLMDFTDLIIRFANKLTILMPSLKICFWMRRRIYRLCNGTLPINWMKSPSGCTLAGDDDQAIYRWAGADVDHFINLPGDAKF